MRNNEYKGQALHRATSYALRHAVEGTYPELYINPAKIRLSDGSYPTFWEEPKIQSNNLTVQLEWVPDADRLTRFEDDHIALWLYNPIEKSLYRGSATRAEGRTDIDVSLEIAGSVLWAYLIVSDRAERYFSNSQCLGSITV